MTFKPRILVVDDEPQMLGLLKEVLACRGAEALCVGTGRQVRSTSAAIVRAGS